MDMNLGVTSEHPVNNIRRVFNKRSSFINGDIDILIAAIRLFGDTHSGKANTLKLIEKINDLYYGNGKLNKEIIKEFADLVGKVVVPTCNLPLFPSLIELAQMPVYTKDERISEEDMDLLSDLFRKTAIPNFGGPESKWHSYARICRKDYGEGVFDPGGEIYKIVESFRYFDLQILADEYAKFSPIRQEVNAFCMFDKCLKKFKTDERIKRMIINSDDTSQQFKGYVGFYCCDDHAMFDRRVGFIALNGLVRQASMTGAVAKTKTSVDDHYGDEWSIPWMGTRVRMSYFVTPLIDVSSEPALLSVPRRILYKYTFFELCDRMEEIVDGLRALMTNRDY